MDTATSFNQIIQLITDGDINSAVALIQDPDVDVNHRDVTHDLQTLMMRICYMTLSITDLERVLAAIFDKTPDVNSQDSWGRTALMHACIANKPGYIEDLLELSDTDVLVTDFDGNNALLYAVQNCDIYTMEDILNHQHGAPLATKINAKGQSALTIAQKSGDKSVISLIESYANKSVCLKNKKKQRKPRNRDTIRLPLAYSPSPERAGHMTNRSIGKPLMSLSLPNSPDRTMENYLSQRPRQSKVDLKLNIGGRELYSKCDSAPVVRSDVTVDNGEGHPLALTSARLERYHYKRDSLRHQPSSIQSDDVLPDLDLDIGNRDFIPDNHLRKQRRPSISLPDLRMAGFLVQSGGSTPTSEDDSGSDSECLKDSSPELDQEDNVFTQSYQSTKVARGVKTTKQSDRQFTLPEIGNHSPRASSQFSTTNHISPLARSRKYSNSDDQLQRTC